MAIDPKSPAKVKELFAKRYGLLIDKTEISRKLEYDADAIASANFEAERRIREFRERDRVESVQERPALLPGEYGKVIDEGGKGVTPFEAWGYLDELLTTFQSHRQVIILKARQLGISTLIAGYCLWKALFYEGSTIYILSQHEIAASKLLAKCKVIWEYLPDFLKVKVGKFQESSITFPACHSSIDALPSTENAGRMTGATIVICDEWARHPYAEPNYLAIRPTLGDGGQFIGLSTPDQFNEKSFFNLMYNKTRNGETDFKKIFLAWDLRPGRDKQWYENEKRNYPSIGFEQEYPSTEDEALKPLGVARFFSEKALGEMDADCMEKPREERLDGIIKIYKHPVAARKYCGALDPSDGQYDPAAGIIIDWHTKEQVADLHGKLRTDELAVLWDSLTREYNNAFHAEETNAQAGGAVIAKLKELQASRGDTNPNAYFQKKDKMGWWTSGNSRPTILLKLAEGINNGEYIIHNPDIISELRSFIVPEGKEPRSMSGKHDDYVLALAILNEIAKQMPIVGTMRAYSVPLRES